MFLSNNTLLLLLLLLITLNTLDYITTVIAIQDGLKEANIVVSKVIEHGLEAYALVKTFSACLVVYVMIKKALTHEKTKKVAYAGLVLAVVLYVLCIVNNVYVILLSRINK